MATKKEDTTKKVTEIDNAKVTIEVEEVAEKKEPEVTEETTTEASAQDPKEESKPEEVMSLDGDSSGFGWKKLILTILIIVPIGFLAFGGFLYFSKNMNLDLVKKQSEKKLVIPETPTATPTPEEVDKEEFTIEVQNGSGIAGEGATVGELLEDEGFKVGDIGNADKSNYDETIITVSDEVSDEFIDELTKVLEERGKVGDVEKFATGVDGEVLVIVGSDTTKTTPKP